VIYTIHRRVDMRDKIVAKISSEEKYKMELLAQIVEYSTTTKGQDLLTPIDIKPIELKEKYYTFLFTTDFLPVPSRKDFEDKKNIPNSTIGYYNITKKPYENSKKQNTIYLAGYPKENTEYGDEIENYFANQKKYAKVSVMIDYKPNKIIVYYQFLAEMPTFKTDELEGHTKSYPSAKYFHKNYREEITLENGNIKKIESFNEYKLLGKFYRGEMINGKWISKWQGNISKKVQDNPNKQGQKLFEVLIKTKEYFEKLEKDKQDKNLGEI